MRPFLFLIVFLAAILAAAACAMASVSAAAPDARARFAFQIPTYLVEKSDPERDAFTCDPAQPLCKLNLDLSPTFSGESASAWACALDFGMGTPTGEEAKCNPNTVTLTGGTLVVRLRAWRKAAPQDVFSRELSVTVRAAPSVPEPSAPPAGSGSNNASSGGGMPPIAPDVSASGSSQTGVVMDGVSVAGSGIAGGGGENGAPSGFAGSGGNAGSGTDTSNIPAPEAGPSGTGVTVGTGTGAVAGMGSATGSAASGPALEAPTDFVAGTGAADVGDFVVPVDPPASPADVSGGGSGGILTSGTSSGGTAGASSEAETPSAGGTGSLASAAAVSSGSGAALSPLIVVQSGLDGQGRCLKPDCAANFASSLSGSSYACAWDLDGGTFSSASSSGSCNPSYAHFPAGSGYRVRLSVRAKSGASGSAILDVVNPFATSVATNTVTTYVERVTESSPPPAPAVAFPPVARIALQGRLTSRFWAEGKSAGCTAASGSGCTFNFDGRTSSAAAGASYAWDWGFGSGASGVNPGAVKFPLGTWTVILAVKDAYGASTDAWSVEVARETAPRVVGSTGATIPAPVLASGSGSPDVRLVPDARIVRAPSSRCGYLSDGVTWACAAPAPVSVKTVPPPDDKVFSVRIDGQGVTGAGRSFTGGAYVCATKQPSCSVNLAASAVGGKAVAWSWEFSDGFAYAGPNPPARAFPRGESLVAVTATSADGRAARAEVRVVVAPPAPKKAVKKAAPKKASGSGARSRADSGGPSRDGASSWAFSAEPQGPLEANAPLGWAALAASGASGISWLLARRWRA